MSAPTAPIHPAMNMAISLLDLLQDAAPQGLEVVFTSTERHRLLGGKTASLLRAGDIVALRDLDPTRGEDHVGGEVATVTEVVPHDQWSLRVFTAERRSFAVPRNRLLVTLRLMLSFIV